MVAIKELLKVMPDADCEPTCIRSLSGVQAGRLTAGVQIQARDRLRLSRDMRQEEPQAGLMCTSVAVVIREKRPPG